MSAQAFNPAAVLLVAWILQTNHPDFRTFLRFILVVIGSLGRRRRKRCLLPIPLGCLLTPSWLSRGTSPHFFWYVLTILYQWRVGTENIHTNVLSMIERTSALTLSFCGILREIILILTSNLMLHASAPAMQVVGYCITVCGLPDHALSSK